MLCIPPVQSDPYLGGGDELDEGRHMLLALFVRAQPKLLGCNVSLRARFDVFISSCFDTRATIAGLTG